MAKLTPCNLEIIKKIISDNQTIFSRLQISVNNVSAISVKNNHHKAIIKTFCKESKDHYNNLNQLKKEVDLLLTYSSEEQEYILAASEEIVFSAKTFFETSCFQINFSC